MQAMLDEAGIDTVWFGVAAELNDQFAGFFSELFLPQHVNELGIALLEKNTATFKQLISGEIEVSGIALDNFLVKCEQMYVQDFYFNHKVSTQMNGYLQAMFIFDGAIQPDIISTGIVYINDKYGSFNYFDTYHRIELGQAMMSQRRHGVN